MKKYNGSENVRKFYLFYNAFYIVALATILAVYFIFRNFWLNIFLVFIYCFALRATSVRLSKKYIMSVLMKDADAEKFRDMVYGGGIFSRDGVFVILAEYFNGALQKTVDICTEKMKDKKCQRFKYTYMSYLAAVYSQTGDRSELEYICNMFYSDVESRADGESIKSKFPVFEYYRRALQDDKVWCMEYLKKETEKQGLDRLSKANVLFNYGEMLYMDGKFEEAREYFSTVAELGPKCVFGKKAAEYLQRIDGGLAYEMNRIKIIPNTGVQIPSVSRGSIISAAVAGVTTAIVLMLIWIDVFM